MHVKYTLALCQNVAIMSIILSILYVCSDISDESVDFVHADLHLAGCWYGDGGCR